ncbi:MAG: arsenate reductase ArsC [Bacteroidales bacterium]|nr:arsenate reductase ArsC [Bacteroidales bacterium]MDD4672205.1 arsenate reductase ArsC [Bacteroidales bacterium]
MKILILCTGNSCRSQMAEGFLKSYDSTIEVHSAGTEPSSEVHPLAIKAMAEVDIDISQNKPKDVGQFTDQHFDYVITVCDDANLNCPVFTGTVDNRWHIGFDDPALAKGTEEEVMSIFRKIRDEIGEGFSSFYKSVICGDSSGSDCSGCSGCS